jgi:hypothetical protein
MQKNQIRRCRSRNRAVRLEQDRFSIDVEFMVNSSTEHAITTPLEPIPGSMEDQHRKWTTYLDGKTERSAALRASLR